MTTKNDSTDNAAYLLGLPPSVQSELARITRHSQRMTEAEIIDALSAFVGVAEAFVDQRHAPYTVAMLDAVARLLQASHYARQEQ